MKHLIGLQHNYEGEKMTEWVIPCNPEYYNIDEAFENFKSIKWKQYSSNFNIDDIVYIYIGKPTMSIKYKCVVSKINLTEKDIDDSMYNGLMRNVKYMELTFLKVYERGISLAELKDNGVAGYIQGPRRINEKLKDYIHKLEC